MPIDASHLMASRAIDRGQATETQSQNILPRLGRQIVRLFRSDQLAVHDPTTNQHIATGVTMRKLSELRMCDATGGPTGTAHRAKDINRSDRLLNSMGVPTNGLGNESLVRFARIGVEDRTMAADLSALHTEATNGNLQANTAIHLARAAETLGVGRAGPLITVAQQGAHGTLPRAIADQITLLANTQPEAALKLASRALDTSAGAPNCLSLNALTWLVSTVSTDNVSHDLHGPNFGADVRPHLPDATTLGFQPALHIPLPDIDYNAAKGIHNGEDGFHFDDATKTVSTRYNYQQMVEVAPILALPMRTEARNLVGGNLEHWATVEQAFGDPQAVETRQEQRISLLAECAREYDQFDFTHYDATVSTATLTNGLNGLNAHNAIEYLLDANHQNFPGFSISENHSTPDAKAYLRANMNDLVQQGVTTLYIEHLLQGYQPLVDQYLNSPVNTPMPRALESFLRGSDNGNGISANYPDNLRGLVETAKTAGVRVLGMDDNSLSRRVAGTANMEVRDVTVNRLGENVVNNDHANRGGGKYVILAGGKHNSSHPGLTTGIPGFGALLNIPSVRPQPNGSLQLHDDVIGDRHA